MDLSIVVCTRNRVATLPQLLKSIAIAVERAGTEAVELVVVDNGSTDGTGACVQAWAETVPIRVALVREEQPGLARARNIGVAHASGRLLAFTDDDCRLAPDYLVQLLALDTRTTGFAVWGGRVELGDPTDLPFTIKTETTPAIYRGERHPGGFIHGCNMAMTRSSFDRVGPFDPRFGAGARFKSAEDTDHTYRAYLAGAEVSYVPDLVVTHFHGRKDIADIMRLQRVYAIGNGALYLKHIRHWNLFRNFIWDVKGSFRELRGGAPIDTVFGFRYRDNVLCCLAGMWRLASTVLGDVIARRQHRTAL